MSNLWWLEPGWKETPCAQCGAKIWPEGDPDHGVCYSCYMQRAHEEEQHQRALEEEERQRWENEQMEEHFRKHPHG